MKRFLALFVVVLGGCGQLSTADLKPADAANTTQPSVQANAGKPKVKQWFTPDTPETLPKEKLDKMTLTGGGFAGY